MDLKGHHRCTVPSQPRNMHKEVGRHLLASSDVVQGNKLGLTKGLLVRHHLERRGEDVLAFT